jgi:hypothetical protein
MRPTLGLIIKFSSLLAALFGLPIAGSNITLATRFNQGKMRMERVELCKKFNILQKKVAAYATTLL